MTDGIKKAEEYIMENSGYIDKAIAAQCAVWRGEAPEMPPLALSCGLNEEQQSWLPGYNTNETHFDSEKMYADGLRGVLSAVNGGYGAAPSMRANMGCGIVPSLFGRQQRLFDDKMPWMLDHVDKDEINEDRSFDINDSAEFAAAMAHMEYMTEKLRECGLAGRVFVYPLDLQGPIDTAHLVYGDDIFYQFYDDPEFTHLLLGLSCDAVYFAMDECFKRIDKSGEFVAHYNHLILPANMGGIKISEDTTTLLSPALIDAFARPYLHKMLDFFGGGYTHYCGKNAHLLDVLISEPLVAGINFGNPEMHDMAEVLSRCRGAGKVYTGALPRQGGETHFEFFARILERAYNRDTGCFYIIPQYYCDLREREQVVGEFERAVEFVINKN